MVATLSGPGGTTTSRQGPAGAEAWPVEVVNPTTGQATEVTLDQIRALLAGVLDVTGTVATDVDVSGLATEATAAAVLAALAAGLDVRTGLDQPLTDNQLRATQVATRDRDAVLEVLPDQTYVDAALTFTFAGPSGPWITPHGTETLRVTVDDDTTASDGHGIPIPAGAPFPIPVVATTVHVWAAPGQRVSVYGTR